MERQTMLVLAQSAARLGDRLIVLPRVQERPRAACRPVPGGAVGQPDRNQAAGFSVQDMAG